MNDGFEILSVSKGTFSAGEDKGRSSEDNPRVPSVCLLEFADPMTKFHRLFTGQRLAKLCLLFREKAITMSWPSGAEVDQEMAGSDFSSAAIAGEKDTRSDKIRMWKKQGQFSS